MYLLGAALPCRDDHARRDRCTALQARAVPRMGETMNLGLSSLIRRICRELGPMAQSLLIDGKLSARRILAVAAADMNPQGRRARDSWRARATIAPRLMSRTRRLGQRRTFISTARSQGGSDNE